MRPHTVTWMSFIHTDMYALVPTNVFAIDSTSCPLTPKSAILICPSVFIKILLGFTSGSETDLV